MQTQYAVTVCAIYTKNSYKNVQVIKLRVFCSFHYTNLVICVKTTKNLLSLCCHTWVEYHNSPKSKMYTTVHLQRTINVRNNSVNV